MCLIGQLFLGVHNEMHSRFLLSVGMLYFSVSVWRKSHPEQFLNRMQINHRRKSHPAKEKSNTRVTHRGPAIN